MKKILPFIILGVVVVGALAGYFVMQQNKEDTTGGTSTEQTTEKEQGGKVASKDTENKVSTNDEVSGQDAENPMEESESKTETTMTPATSVNFEEAYAVVLERSFQEVVLSYVDDLFENKFYDTNVDGTLGVKSPFGNGDITFGITGKAGRDSESQVKADLDIKANVDVNAPAMQIVADGSVEALMKAVGSKTYMNLKSFDINSENPQVAMVEQQAALFINKWILSDSSDMGQIDMANINDFDLAGFVALLSDLLKQYPIVKQVGESTEGEYKVYDLKLDADNIYKISEELAKSKYAEDMQLSLQEVQEGKADLINEINNLEYDSKFKVKDSQNMILELNVVDGQEKVDIEVGITPEVSTLDMDVSDGYTDFTMTLSKKGDKIDFSGGTKESGGAELGQGQGSLEIVKSGNNKKINFNIVLKTQAADVSLDVNVDNTGIEDFEIIEPEGAKTMEELIQESMGGGEMPQEMPEGYEIPEGYEVPEGY